MNELDTLALKYRTDKASSYHSYTQLYEWLFKNNREDFKNILEIGVWGGASLKMWADYFVNAKIIGIDLKPIDIKDPRIQTLVGNQTDSKFLNTLPNDFDLIIDDGSHRSEDQIISFNILFPKLKNGGWYIIEDTCCSYWPEFNNKTITTVNFFKNIVDHVNLYGYKANNSTRRAKNFVLGEKRDITFYEKNINLIIFYNSLILIRKEL